MKPQLLFTIALVLSLFFCTQTIYANTYYWTGAVNSNWNTSGNWLLTSCGGTTTSSIPGSSDSAVFSGSCNISCHINTSITVLSIRTDATYSDTIFQGSGYTVTATYAKFAGGAFLGNNAAITFSSLIIENTATFTATSTTTTIKGNFSYTGGTFNHNNGRVVFYKTLTFSGVNTSSSISLYDVEFQAIAGNTTVTLSDIILNVADSTLLTGSDQLFINASQSTSVINAAGEIKDYNTSGTGGGTATIVVNGSSTQYITGNTTTEDVGKLPNLTINSTGTVYLVGYITMGGSTTLTYTAGTVNAGTSKVVFYYDNTITGAMTFNNVEFQGTSSSCVVSNTITVNGNTYTTLTGSVVINTGTIDLYGNLDISNTSGGSGGSAVIDFSGSANDSIVAASGNSIGQGYLPAITISKTGGTLYLSGNITVSHNWTNNYSTSNISPGTSTIYFDGSNATIGGTYSTPLWNVEFGSYGEWTFTVSIDSAFIIKNNLTLIGTRPCYINGNSFNIYNNIIVTNTDGGTTAFNLVGSANDSIISPSEVSVGEYYLPSVNINKTNGTLYLIGNISENGSWTNNYSQANINAGTSMLLFGNSCTIGGTYRTPLWNVEFYGSEEWTFSISDDSALIVKNNLTLGGSREFNVDGNSINIYGNIIAVNTGGGDGGGTTVFNLVGSANDSINSTVGLGECFLPSIYINKTGGTLYLIGNISDDGNWTNNYSESNINAGTSTLYFDLNNLTIGGSYPMPAWNVLLAGSSEETITVSEDSALIIKHNLTIGGDRLFYINGHCFPIYGNIITSNTSGGDEGSTVFNIVGSNNDSIISPSGYTLGECYLPTIYINKTGNTLHLIGNISESGNWNYINGTVNAGTSTVGLYGSSNTPVCATGSDTMSFNNLVIANGTTLGSAVKVVGNLTINSSKTLNTSSNNYQISLAGNWINNGTYTGNNSNVTFNGSLTDSIKGSTNTTFYSITLDKTGTVYLVDPVTITNALNLTSGDILTSSTNLLTLNNGSSVSGGSNNSFVNGPIKKIGNSAFTFPTGAGSSYHPTGITAPSNTSDAFEAQYFNTQQTEGSSTDDSLTYVSTCDYWTLSQPAGSSSSVDVSLFWGTNSCNIDRLSSLRVGYWNGSEWKDLGQSASAGTTSSGSVTATTSSSLSTSNTYFALSKHSPTPTVSAGSNVAICYGTSTTLDATATGGFSPYTYSWSPATGLSSSTASNPIASPTATTTYTVTVEDDDNAPTATATVVVTVNPLPTVTASSSPSTICYNSSSTLTVGGAVTYTWSPATGLSATTGSSVTATLTATTTYTVTGINANGCVNTAAQTITVNPQLIANAGDDTTVYIVNNSPVTITLGGHPSTIGGISPYTYSWSPSEYLSNSTIANPTATLTTPDSITYTLNVTDSNGCTSSSAAHSRAYNAGFSIGYVNNGKKFPILALLQIVEIVLGLFAGGDTIILYFSTVGVSCYDYCYFPYTITDLSTHTVIGTYTSGQGGCETFDGGGYNNYNDFHLYIPSLMLGHLYEVCGGTGYACPDTSGPPISNGACVYFELVQPIDSVNFTLDKTTACIGDTFRVSINNSTFGDTISWIFPYPPDSALSFFYPFSTFYPNVGATENFGFCEAGNFTVCLVIQNQCFNDTVCKNITVNSPCDFTYTGGSCDDTVHFTSSSCVGPYTYLWSFGDGGTSGDANPVHIYTTPGSHTVTLNVTYNGTGNNCDTTGQVFTCSQTINIYGPLVLTASSSSICNGKCDTLTVTGGTPIYTWYENVGSSIFDSTSTTSVVVCPTVTNVYAVNNGHCISNRDTVKVNADPTITTSTSMVSICTDSSTFITVSGATSYTWSPSTGLNHSTGSSVIASPTVSTTYTVIGTNSSSCTDTAFVVVAVYNCCTSDSGGTQYLNASSSTLPNSTYIAHPSGTTIRNVPSGQIIFNGTWTINQNTVIDSSIIKFGPTAMIYIEPGETLTVANSTLTDGCDTMWHGIYLVNDSSHLIVDSNSNIEGADTAVYSHSGGVYTITNSTLQNNYIGIYCSTFGSPHQGTVRGSTIEGGSLLDPPHSSEYSAIGMQISHVYNITVGAVDSVNANLFQNMSIGMEIFNSSVNVLNNTFHELNIYNPSSAFPLTQVAIYDTAAPVSLLTIFNPFHLNVGGSAAKANNFTNGTYGIVSKKYVQPYITNNYFNILDAGVYVAPYEVNSIIIDSNTMPNIQYCGIQIFGSYQLEFMQVNYNSITAASYVSVPYCGIWLNTNNWINPNVNNEYSNAQVYFNGVNNFRNGIQLTVSPYTTVFDNAIHMPHVDTVGRFGINNVASNNCYFNENSITDSDYSHHNSYGIYTSFPSTSSFYVCNHINYCNTAMQFNGNNYPSLVNGNYYENSKYGFVLYNNGFIGTQGVIDSPEWNEFRGIDTDLYAINTDAFNFANAWYFDASGSPWYFYISTTESYQAFEYIPTIHTLEDWGSDSCGTHPPPPPALPELAIEDSLFFDIAAARAIVLDTFTYVNNTEAATWMAKENLFSVLLTDSVLIGTAWKSDTILRHFYDTIESTNMGLIAQLINYLATPLDTTGFSTEAAIEAALAFKKYEESEMVASISPTNIIEQNYQSVYSIYVNNMLADSTLDSAKLATLQSVASQCPYTDGAAVYTARGILGGIYSVPFDSTYSFYYNDDSLCVIDTSYDMVLKMKIKPQTPARTPAPSFVTAYPNPAKDQINFIYQYDGTDNATLEVYDILGVKVGEYSLSASSGNYTLGLANYSAGLYFYSLITPCCEVGMGKFIVAK